MSTFDLPGDLSVGADELREALIASISTEDRLVLNAGAVQRVSTASLQVLLNAIRSAGQQGISTRWEAVPAVLLDAATCTGLASALELPNGATPPALLEPNG